MVGSVDSAVVSPPPSSCSFSSGASCGFSSKGAGGKVSGCATPSSGATAALGAKFDRREFHDLVLRTGSVPLTVLEAEVERWMAAKKG